MGKQNIGTKKRAFTERAFTESPFCVRRRPAVILQCAAWMGRISLLGCTRVSDCGVDYYTQVHRPGVKLIGAHNFVRPKVESYPHHWTHHDDCNAILDLIAAKRLQVAPILSRVLSPADAPAVYTQLCEDKNFPLGTVFDWRSFS